MAPLTPPPGVELPAQFGDIDIYLFDQLLRGRFDRRPRVLDAGCGDGRNLKYFLRQGFACFGIDRDAAAIEHVRALAGRLAPDLPPGNFRAGDVTQLPWPVLAPDGMLFARLASNIGLENAVGAAGRRVRLPDGSTRFVVDEAMLFERTGRLGGELLDPIKTTNVQRQRCMTTWVLRKN
jgi:tellurite methyltransferase